MPYSAEVNPEESYATIIPLCLSCGDTGRPSITANTTTTIAAVTNFSNIISTNTNTAVNITTNTAVAVCY